MCGCVSLGLSGASAADTRAGVSASYRSCSAGRLYQVEYAMEAIGHAGTCLGILANDGVLLAAERRNIHKLLDEVFFSEKIYKLNEYVSARGGVPVAHVLT